jgi:hypothetical protein
MCDKRFDGMSTEELLAELGRRLNPPGGDNSSSQSDNSDDHYLGPMFGAELAIEEAGRQMSREAFEAWLHHCEATETDQPKPCPKCGRLIPVRAAK